MATLKIDLHIKKFSDKLFVKNKVSLTVLKLQLVRGQVKAYLDLTAHLRCTTEKSMLFCKLNVVFRSTCRLGTLSRFKDFLKKKSTLE